MNMDKYTPEEQKIINSVLLRASTACDGCDNYDSCSINKDHIKRINSIAMDLSDDHDIKEFARLDKELSEIEAHLKYVHDNNKIECSSSQGSCGYSFNALHHYSLNRKLSDLVKNGTAQRFIDEILLIKKLLIDLL